MEIYLAILIHVRALLTFLHDRSSMRIWFLRGKKVPTIKKKTIRPDNKTNTETKKSGDTKAKGKDQVPQPDIDQSSWQLMDFVTPGKTTHLITD